MSEQPAFWSEFPTRIQRALAKVAVCGAEWPKTPRTLYAIEEKMLLALPNFGKASLHHFRKWKEEHPEHGASTSEPDSEADMIPLERLLERQVMAFELIALTFEDFTACVQAMYPAYLELHEYGSIDHKQGRK